MGAHFTFPEPAEMADVRRELEALISTADIEAHVRWANEARGMHARRELARAARHGAAMLDALALPPVALDVLDAAIAKLDALDGDADAEGEPDDEDDGTAEPVLGAPENRPGRFHVDMDARYHKGRRGRPLGSQVDWAAGGTDDREDTFTDLEPEAGYDLPEGDDERDGSGGASDVDDDEQSLGWNDTVSQLALGTPTDDGDLTALERFGKGFLRSGPDDAEDSDPAEDDGAGEPCDGAWEGNRDQRRWSDMVMSPAIYSMRVEGVCLEPVIPHGSLCIMDAEAAFAPGDFVVVHHDDPNAEGGIATKVKQLAHALPWSVFPVVSEAEILPVISCRMFNPPQAIWYDPMKVHAVHKVVAAEGPDGARLRL